MCICATCSTRTTTQQDQLLLDEIANSKASGIDKMLSYLSYLFSAVGVLSLLWYVRELRKLAREPRVKMHRSERESVADLLVYASVVEDGIIVCKSGAFLAGWLFRMEDISTVTEQHREVLAGRVNAALRDLGSGWMLHIDAVRRPIPEYFDPSQSHFEDDVARAIDDERRELFERVGTMYDGYFVLCATWFPPRLAERKFAEMMFNDDSAPRNAAQQSSHLLSQFQESIKKLENKLSSAMKLTRLRSHRSADGRNDELLAWIHYCLSGRRQTIRLPQKPTYVDNLVGGQEFFGGVVPKMGRNFIQVVAIHGLPLESHPGILQSLAELNFEYRWSTRFIFLDQHESLTLLKRYSAQWSQKMVGFVDQMLNRQGRIDQDAVSMVHDGDAAMAEVKSGHVACGYYTSNIILMSEDREELAAMAERALALVERKGFACRIETINTIDAFLGSLPGHGVENIRRPLVNTLNLADLLPCSSIWSGEMRAPCNLYPPNSPALMKCLTTGSTPFHLNLHIGDLGHTLMIGPTAMGKSTHLGLIVAQLFRYRSMTVNVFEKGQSMYTLTKALKGQHYDLGADTSQLCFCPLGQLDLPEDLAWAAGWFEMILELNGINTTPAQNNEIYSALQRLREADGRTLTDFVLTIQDNRIREVLRQYTLDGAMGHLLDGTEDNLEVSRFSTFETEELMDYPPKFALPVLLYLFRKIEKSLDGTPSAIVLDEAWTLLGNDTFASKIREWLKTMRKANCIVIMATQNIADAVNSGILDTIIESTPTKIFLPNSEAETPVMQDLYRRFGLNDKEIRAIKCAIPKRQYYYRSTSGRRLYELGLGPLALALVGATSKSCSMQVKELERKHGPNGWLGPWLRSRNVLPTGQQEAQLT